MCFFLFCYNISPFVVVNRCPVTVYIYYREVFYR